MINPVHGDLERMYQTTYNRKPSADENNQSKLLKTYEEGRPEIDRTQHILKCLKDKTPGMTDINRGKIRRINHQAQNKVAYAYKERFCGIYEDRKRAGQLTRENSWEKFVNPAKVGINNYIQHALNSEAAEQLKDTQGNNQEDEQPKIEIGADNKDGKESAFDTGRSSKQERKTNFRNALERFHYQYDTERIENINENVTFDRIQVSNKKFEAVIQRAKPKIKLYHLLGYSESQYILS